MFGGRNEDDECVGETEIDVLRRLETVVRRVFGEGDTRCFDFGK